MSATANATAWAARQWTRRPVEKLVLWALADHYDHGDQQRFPSIANLCAFTGLDRKTVIGALDALEAAGSIADTGDRQGCTAQIKVYTLPASQFAPRVAPRSPDAAQ